MTDAQTILKLIETVDPNDTAKLDEIDARVQCLVEREDYLSHHIDHNGFHATVSCSLEGGFSTIWPRRYTRSRDALKTIRPKGWDIKITTHQNSDAWMVFLDGSRNDYRCASAWLPTEELAELYAIIQAIEYERNQK